MWIEYPGCKINIFCHKQKRDIGIHDFYKAALPDTF